MNDIPVPDAKARPFSCQFQAFLVDPKTCFGTPQFGDVGLVDQHQKAPVHLHRSDRDQHFTRPEAPLDTGFVARASAGDDQIAKRLYPFQTGSQGEISDQAAAKFLDRVSDITRCDDVAVDDPQRVRVKQYRPGRRPLEQRAEPRFTFRQSDYGVLSSGRRVHQGPGNNIGFRQSRRGAPHWIDPVVMLRKQAQMLDRAGNSPGRQHRQHKAYRQHDQSTQADADDRRAHRGENHVLRCADDDSPVEWCDAGMRRDGRGTFQCRCPNGAFRMRLNVRPQGGNHMGSNEAVCVGNTCHHHPGGIGDSEHRLNREMASCNQVREHSRGQPDKEIEGNMSVPHHRHVDTEPPCRLGRAAEPQIRNDRLARTEDVAFRHHGVVKR